MIKGIVIGIVICFGIFDVLLILGCAKLERIREDADRIARLKEVESREDSKRSV